MSDSLAQTDRTSTGGREKDPDKRRKYIVVVTIGLSLGILLLVQSLYRGHLSAVTEYDDGVYFAASINLVHGLIPYKDFVFLQPPMITVWLAPFAGLASLTGTRFAMEAARLFVDLVTVTNVVLVAAIVRRLSLTRFTLACAIMALSVGTLQASQTILIEPFLVSLCLLATLCVMQGYEITQRTSRIWIAGCLFGIAGATKVWAVFPMFVVLWTISKTNRRKAVSLLLGTALGFGICIAPFLLRAPTQLIHQVLVTQAQRGFSGESVAHRIEDLTGIALLTLLSHINTILGIAATVVTMSTLLYLLRRIWRPKRSRSWTSLEKVTLGSAAVTGSALLVAPSYYYHYAAFLAPYIALTVASLSTGAQLRNSNSSIIKTTELLRKPVVFIGVYTLIWCSDLFVALNPPIRPARVTPAVVASLAHKGCDVTTDPALLLLSNEFTGSLPSCPHVIDWNGTERSTVNGVSGEPPDQADPKLQSILLSWLERSSTVTLGTIDAGLGQQALDYLNRHFTHHFYPSDGVTIYRRQTGSTG